MKIVNKKARSNYEISDSFEAGIVLTGAEVKSIKEGRANLGDSFVKIIGGELWIVNMDIPRYKNDGNPNYDSKESRKLLVKRNEIFSIEGKMKSRRLTLIPVSLYVVRGKIKVEVGFGRGIKRHEKKAKEKERTLDRDLLYESRKYVV